MLGLTIALGGLIGLALVAAGISDAASDFMPVAVVFTAVAAVLLLVYVVVVVGTVVPLLAVSVRRLHDANRSGFWLLLAFFAPFGALVVLYFLATASNPLRNEWGPSPHTARDDLIEATSHGTATDDNADGPVVGWVTPPQRGPESTQDRVVKVVAVAVIAIVIAAFLGGFAYAWTADDRDAAVVLPWEAAPTPTQTASTPEPVSSTALAKWEEFISHFVDSSDELYAITMEFADIDFDDADAVDANALRLQRWADGEAEWLDAHPVDSCYAGTYTPWSKTVTLLLDEGHGVDQTQFLAEMDKVTESILISDVACTG